MPPESRPAVATASAAANGPSEAPALAHADYEMVDGGAAVRANTRWWSGGAAEYLAEHGEFLGNVQFRWCPEGLLEADAHLLGPLAELMGARVLEVGAGAAQCSRWLRAQGVEANATDVAPGMVAAAAQLDAATGVPVPMSVADARSLPFADATFDVVFTAFGAIPFVPDAHRVHAEAARVLRPGGLWVFAVTHPIRWAFPDDPSSAGLALSRSYFDRTPYVERAADGEPLYAEYHRTLGDHIRDVVAADLIIEDVIEPDWPEENRNVWGGWGPERGALLPGTAIFRTRTRDTRAAVGS